MTPEEACPQTAHRLRGAIGGVFRFAIITSRSETDPTAALGNWIFRSKGRRRAAAPRPLFFELRAARGVHVPTRNLLQTHLDGTSTILNADNGGLQGSQENDRQRDCYNRPKDGMNPQGRREAELDSQCRADQKRAQKEDHGNGRCISRIVSLEVQITDRAASLNSKKTHKKMAFSTSRTQASERRANGGNILVDHINAFWLACH